jgi:tRNA pseudouridine32 synthase/23S rRNA pseudouridine746 synthase
LAHSFFTPLTPQPTAEERPASFTYPFYYQPSLLSLQAVEQLQYQLKTDPYFGLSGQEGKMLGVLVVENQKGEVGFLRAYSGQLSHESRYFVPSLFDFNASASFLHIGQAKINAINQQLDNLQSNTDIVRLEKRIEQQQNQADIEVAVLRQEIIAGRKARKQQRAVGLVEYSSQAYQTLLDALAKKSIANKNQLKVLVEKWRNKIAATQQALSSITADIELLSQHRKQLSTCLQQRLFEHYHFLNAKGEQKSLLYLFKSTPQGKPPAGSGDCAAPKLLQYAYQHRLKPLAMAEFWWGDSPKSAIRHHGQFYGACQGKCKPILTHMLEGLDVEPNPLLENHGADKTLTFIYQDDVMLVINKPPELLSVPGKQIQDCVYTRLRDLFPKASGPLIVHRLDMSTSGLMVIALNKQAHKKLQQQFIQRSVKKRYVAILDGELEQRQGLIDLPLRVDLNDRPRQLVCYDYGRSAQTRWQVVEIKENKTRVYFYPITGRTHQLRVHSAHDLGLSTPILGDDIYGKKTDRLHLHAETLEIDHPKTKQRLIFQSSPDF